LARLLTYLLVLSALVQPIEEVIFIEEEHLEEGSEESVGPTQMEVENSVLWAYRYQLP
jgi:hypothetical protein